MNLKIKLKAGLIFGLVIFNLSGKSFAQNPSVDQKTDADMKKELKLEFSEAVIHLNYSLKEPEEFESLEMKTSETALIKIKTPQFSAQPFAVVPATLLKDFKGFSNLEADIKAEGFTDGMKQWPMKPKKQKIQSGVLYQWTTPSFGSSTYFYLQHPKRKNLALKLGPVGGPSPMQVDWAQVKWTLTSPK